jgi:hypothetical protein
MRLTDVGEADTHDDTGADPTERVA